MFNFSRSTVFFASVLLLFTWGCDSGGGGGGGSAVDTVAVTGTKVSSDFQKTGKFGVSATPLDRDRRGIISNNVQGKVKIEHNPSKSGKNHSSDIEATVTVDSIRQASGNPVAAPIVLDASGSMGRLFSGDTTRVDVAKDGAEAFVDELDSGGTSFESAVFDFPLTFSFTNPSSVNFNDTKFRAGFTGDTDSLETAIGEVSASGGTPMYSSLAEVLIYSDTTRSSANYQKAIVLLADGQPNSTALRDSVCRDAQRKNSPIFGIGIGPASDLSDNPSPGAVAEMREISSCSGGAYTGLTPDSLQVEQAFTAAATGSSQGSINYGVEITKGLSELQTGDTIRGTLTVTSGGSSSSGTFTFTVPASSSTSRSYKYK
jgi:Mg-chelatase subunit ChlD